MNPRRRELLIAAGLWSVFGGSALAAPSAPRRLDLKNPHTGETFIGPYRDACGPIPGAMADLAEFLRDFHQDEIGPVHIATLDFLSDVMAASDQRNATVLSAYRTKATNDMLRAAMFPAAEKSQHLVGRAVDVTFDRRLLEAKNMARRMQRGGVGWYPNSHFIHLDSGPVRHWEIGDPGVRRFLFPRPGAPRRQVFTVRFRLKLHRTLARQEFLHRHGR